MENLNKSISLFNDANKIRKFIESHKEAIRPSAVDKHSLKFVIGGSDRFNAQKLSMYLECYKGHYGNSSCYTEYLASNSKEVEQAFVTWANKNMQLIFDGIASELEIQAKTLKDKCFEEITAAKKAYERAFGDDAEYPEEGGSILREDSQND